MSKKKNGMTLVEVILAMAILSIIMIGFLNLFAFSFTNIASNGSRTGASYKAQSIVDGVSSGNYTSESEIESYFSLQGHGIESNEADVEVYVNKPVNYNVTPDQVIGVDGVRLTVVVFYSKHEKRSTMKLFIPF
ncbi:MULTISPECIES: prepilin-type N-terminal cleavage/methylation domain-containing protein [unclassified Fusibacter]|uniref:type IV pilus modification PilV family protein n=1 Tax=unclassified Fusibacter TaxID=2624464 RepID=UPI001012E1E4|nr:MULTISPECIES: type II secretion system protein [unclassified Fusibacter]MCK8058902.1 prepilin-type N-terminal cleavage/methylation domain-containing protein [Fusibacter sp. A2]NPE21976.1 prepilin-type N-terminal cleavage/methylation domain-containing protein [Fusibacter sp. A1]RXV61544.1 prepilin-type N-terminal cleavage/methylation domain-containing protein [Fusibacter sp. A1]